MIGTLGGYEARKRLVAATGGRDLPIALRRGRGRGVRRAADRELGVMSRKFDAIIVGAGQAGPSLAGRLTAAGMSVAVIERKLFGGTCVNTGCIPTKTLVASAYAAHMARRGGDFGVLVGGPVAVDMKKVKARKDEVSGDSRRGLEVWLDGMERCTVFRGHARFESPRTISVNGETLEAERIFLNLGGRAHACPTMPGLDQVNYLTNTTILELDTLPRHLVIVGGSYIGLEFAQMYRRFGAEVTVIERGVAADPARRRGRLRRGEGHPRKRRHHCPSRCRLHRLRAPGRRHCASTGAGEPGGGRLACAAGDRTAAEHRRHRPRQGRRCRPTSRGYITVDDQLQTNVPGIWALGDCNGKGAFTHTSYNDFEIVAANLLDNDPRRVSDRITTYALYIDPPLGRAGLTETAVRKSGRQGAGRHAADDPRRPRGREGRDARLHEGRGRRRTRKEILGAAILGVGGDEAIHGILDVMSAKAPYTRLQRTMHIHPTVSELIPTMLGEMKPLV